MCSLLQCYGQGHGAQPGAGFVRSRLQQNRHGFMLSMAALMATGSGVTVFAASQVYDYVFYPPIHNFLNLTRTWPRPANSVADLPTLSARHICKCLISEYIVAYFSMGVCCACPFCLRKWTCTTRPHSGDSDTFQAPKSSEIQVLFVTPGCLAVCCRVLFNKFAG